MDTFTIYIFALLIIITGFLIVKKVATCLIKSLVLIAIIGILLLLYYFGAV